MHSAPSVTYPVERSRVWGLAVAGVWLVGVLLTGAWCGYVDAVGWRQWLAMACVVATGVVAVRHWRAAAVGELHWDGMEWWWTEKMAPGGRITGRLVAHLDLQRWLLVRLCDTAGGQRWLWLEQCRQPARWSDLRRAVHSRARVAVEPASMPSPQ